MLKIKLARFGKRHQPEYRIVVNEARDKRDGAYVALLGTYAPTRNPKVLTLDLKAYDEWLKKGAQPTETVANLAKRMASGNPFPPKKKQLSKKALAKKQAEKETKAQEKTAEVAEKSQEKAQEVSEANTQEAKTQANQEQEAQS